MGCYSQLLHQNLTHRVRLVLCRKPLWRPLYLCVRTVHPVYEMVDPAIGLQNLRSAFTFLTASDGRWTTANHQGASSTAVHPPIQPNCASKNRRYSLSPDSRRARANPIYGATRTTLSIRRCDPQSHLFLNQCITTMSLMGCRRLACHHPPQLSRRRNGTKGRRKRANQ